MLRHAWKLWLGSIAAFAGAVLIEHWLMEYYAIIPGVIDAFVIKLFLTVMVCSTALFFIALIDTVVWPELSIMSVALGEGRWASTDPIVRAAVLLTYGIFLSSFVIAWSSIIAGD